MAQPGVDTQGALATVPPAMVAVFTALRSARPRTNVELHEIPAPGRGVAPFGVAFEAALLGPGSPREGTDDPMVTGRFVVLHDPAGQAAWGATTRIVVLVQGAVDEVTGGDPLLPEVTWSWLRESLQECGAQWHSDRGTVTTTASRRFGARQEDESAPEWEVELRASWSPTEPGDLLPHLGAFCDFLGAVAGVPPTVNPTLVT